MVLCNASYYGTVAAIRSLGRAGIPVVAVDTGLLSTGRRSRYAKSYLSSPPFDSADWSDWLLALGRDGVRRAIYATSDAVSFALADRREELSSVFDLYQPSLETMMCILDKGLLHRHARAVGIETPETWFPQSANEADGIVREAGGQIVAKPRSQLCASSGAKGMLISAVTNRGSVYDRLFKHFGLSNAFTKRFPEMAMPMLQRYHPEAMKKIYSLSGFRDRSGSHIVMQAALKILQQPRHLGIGVCFEEAEVIPDIAQKTIRLCERIGYYGAFELEFIVAQGQMLLIDFNGRFYNQLAFDIARGMKLYYARWHHRHPSAADLREALVDAAPEHRDTIRNWFDQQVYAADFVDDAVDQVESEEILPRPGRVQKDGKIVELTRDDIKREINARRDAWDRDRDAGPFPYRSVVRARRHAAQVPQTLVVEFADGSQEKLAWPVGERWHRWVFERPVNSIYKAVGEAA